MKRNLYILLPVLGLSAALLAACGSQSTPDSVTQQITSNQDALAAGASSSTVQITENKDDDASLPAAGETVPLAANASLQAAAGSGQTAYISEADAKKIAMEHAGVKEEDISYFKLKLDTDDGIVEYDIKFYVGNAEYEYDIDAVTGTIRSFDTELSEEHHQNGTQGSSNAAAPAGFTDGARGSGGITAAAPAGSISEADAKKIALEQVPGATENNLRLKTDYDDGRMKYEIKIVYNEIKYEFDIDAATGKILEWESESIYD